MAMTEQFSVERVIGAIKAVKGNLSEAAEALGCERRTLVHYSQRHKAVKDAVEAERQARIDLAEKNLDDRLKKKYWPATKLTLTTLGKDRGYTERQEISGVGGGAIEIDHDFKKALDKVYGKTKSPDELSASDTPDQP